MTYPRLPYRTDCARCPLRRLPLFEPFDEATLEFMRRFKAGELVVEPGTQILMEGAGSTQLYTALHGMGIRYKTLENGARQVVNFVFPGDFIGLQAAVMGEMRHSVAATTAMTLCVFDRASLWEVFRGQPQRAFDLTWSAAVEEHFLGEALISLGQRPGIDRMAWALLRMYRRLAALGLETAEGVPLPYRQQDLADALGLSLVHTNKSLQKLRQLRLIVWSKGRLRIPSLDGLAAVAQLRLDDLQTRPLL